VVGSGSTLALRLTTAAQKLTMRRACKPKFICELHWQSLWQKKLAKMRHTEGMGPWANPLVLEISLLCQKLPAWTTATSPE